MPNPSASTSSEPAAAGHPLITIEATRGWGSLQLGELWRCRELRWFLTMRDLLVPLGLTLLMLVSGAYAFRRTERTIVDLPWLASPRPSTIRAG